MSTSSSTPSPIVAVTATSESIRGMPRVRLNTAYVRSLEEAGLIPLIVPPFLEQSAAEALLERVDGLVLTGGEDINPAEYGAEPHPKTDSPVTERDRTELRLARAAQSRALPTLAICRGMQLVNVAFGGTLVQDIPSIAPSAIAHAPGRAKRAARVHDVTVVPESRLAAALRATAIRVNSSHHQAVDRLGSGLRASAYAADGTIEGAESEDPTWWMLAVQWHPEELTKTRDDWDRRLFSAFAASVVGRR